MAAYHEQEAKAAFDVVVRHFEAREWKFETEAERLVLKTGFKGRNHAFKVSVFVDADDPMLMLHVHFGLFAPEGCRPAVAEVITRLNYSIKFGRWEMDFNDGEVRLVTAHRFGVGGLDGEVLEFLLDVSFMTSDRYAPALFAVAFGEVAPQEAIAKVRSGGKPADRGQECGESERARLEALVKALRGELEGSES